MSIFGIGKKNEGGIMDTIRCDEKDFLIWKWRPVGQNVNSTNKENAVRMGSSISVRPGQAAILLYKQDTGGYDVIKGPYNGILKTENLPVLSSIIGLAYSGGTPFQAEIYYINLAKNLEVPFTVPYFRVIPAQPEYKAYDIRVAIKGTLVFEVSANTDMVKYLFEAWGGSDTTLVELKEQMLSLLTQEVKSIVANIANETGIFIMHFNSLIGEMGQYILAKLQNRIANRFGVFATDVTISDIRYDEDADGYAALRRITEKQATIFNLENEKTALLSYQIQRDAMTTDSKIRNQSAEKMAEMQLANQADMMSRMRQEGQFAQHLQSTVAAQQAQLMNEANANRANAYTSESQFAQHQQTVVAAQQAQLMNQANANRANAATDVAAYRSNLSSETSFLPTHQINVQADVMKTGLSNMGNMSNMNNSNPAAMVTGVMMGGAVGGQVSQMINNMGNALNSDAGAQQTPPPLPNQKESYYIVVNNQQAGPFYEEQIIQLMQTGQINGLTLAWCKGMANWMALNTIPAFNNMNNNGGQCPPPIPNNQ